MPLRTPQLSPETHREWESLAEAGVPGVPGVTSKAKLQIQLFQAQHLFLGKEAMLSRKLQRNKCLLFSSPFYPPFFFFQLSLCEYDLDLCLHSLIRLTMPN